MKHKKIKMSKKKQATIDKHNKENCRDTIDRSIKEILERPEGDLNFYINNKW